MAVVPRGPATGRFAVETRDGVMLGGAGAFRVTLEDEATRTESLTDEVKVFGGGVQVDVGAAKGNRVSQGQAPTDPVDLLQPGTPLTPEEGATLRWTDFSWVPDEGALAYRIEVSRDPFFVDLVHMQDHDAEVWSPELLVLPVRVDNLWWRITCSDSFGFYGLPSESRSLLVPTGIGQ